MDSPALDRHRDLYKEPVPPRVLAFLLYRTVELLLRSQG